MGQSNKMSIKLLLFEYKHYLIFLPLSSVFLQYNILRFEPPLSYVHNSIGTRARENNETVFVLFSFFFSAFLNTVFRKTENITKQNTKVKSDREQFL